MSGPAPRKPPGRPRPRRRTSKRPPGRHSPWAYLAPAALLGAVTVIVLILSAAGVIGHPADGAPPSPAIAGPVETLPVPDTPPPPEPAPPPPPPLPPPPPPKTTKTTTSGTTTSTTTTGSDASTSTTPTTGSTTPADTATTQTDSSSGGQRVKWTVKPGDTLFSIATQFGTSVKELQRLNPQIDPSALQVGQTLVVK
jgi:LysM repeat protein